MHLTPEVEALATAYLMAGRSKDPTTQVGAVVMWDQLVVAEGWNRLPAGISDERWAEKERYVIHAEHDAVFNAAAAGWPMGRCTLVAPWFACLACARTIAHSGIRRVVGHHQLHAAMQKWRPEWNTLDAIELLQEAGVAVEWWHGPVNVGAIRVAGRFFDPKHTGVAA